jgi:DNA polymerase alpha subunit A
MADVYTEFETLRKKHGIQEYMSKSVVRKYAFEKQDVPQESEYLKVVYPFTENTFPKITGDSFSHIFGRETNILELFLLKRKIMGPCWLKIKNVSLEERNVSWCKFELSVQDLKSIEVSQGDERGVKTPPGLVVMSLNLRTIMDMKKSVNEIVCASALVLKDGKIYLIS